MAIKCYKKYCIGVSAVFAVLGCVLIVVGIVEKFRFQTFYSPIMCTHGVLALRMTKVSFPPGVPGIPAGKMPYGLWGYVTDLVQTCENPNEYDINFKKQGQISRLYLPNMTNFVDGKPYSEIAQSYLANDVTLEAKSTAQMVAKINGSAPFEAFGAIGFFANTMGYVPLYTKVTGAGGSCLTLFGIRMCEEKVQEAWCGTLAGPCVVDVPGTNMTEQAICTYTRAVCRSSEAEMKALTTPTNLGLTILGSLPCHPATGLIGMNCSTKAAAGIVPNQQPINKQQPIPGYVDGPNPSADDIEKGENAIALFTGLVIAVGVVLTILCSGIAACLCRRKKKAYQANEAPAPLPQQPAILTSAGNAAGQDGKEEVSV